MASKVSNKANSSIKVDPPASFVRLCHMIGESLNKELKSRNLERVEAAAMLRDWDISFHNAYLRVLTLNTRPTNITILTLCKVFDAFDLELVVRRKKLPK